MSENIRNIAIIAHVDHGKTTLVDRLLEFSKSLEHSDGDINRIMDSNTLEKERGITILSKNVSIIWNNYQINIIDTPGHADFSGEVERIMSMADSVLLLVDAVEGPMPQTRFVTEKAFSYNLNPIVVINKIDRPGARVDWVIDQTFDLFDNLGASDEQLDFPIVYTSALKGYATLNENIVTQNMDDLFKTIIEKVPSPKVDKTGKFQMQISSIDYSSFIGAIGIGKIKRGTLKPNSQVSIIDYNQKITKAKIGEIFTYSGLERKKVLQASAGNIVCITGIPSISISDTICDSDCVESLPPLSFDSPKVSMTFQVNTSPFSGLEGKFITARQIKNRLEKEMIFNVSLKIDQLKNEEAFKVSGRGELHLSILLESMRREEFEIAVSRPQAILKEIDGVLHEPYELVVVNTDDKYQGNIIKYINIRQGETKNIKPDGTGRVILDFIVPSKGLIGFHSDFLNITSGTGVVNKTFSHYGKVKKSKGQVRKNGVLISNIKGKASAYALFNLQSRGTLFINPGTMVYEGMIIGIHSRENDLNVNPCKGKQLSNVRASGKDESIILSPPMKMDLEKALGFINDDELIEITPKSIRIRKKILPQNMRK